jgi:hypothetical protein
MMKRCDATPRLVIRFNHSQSSIALFSPFNASHHGHRQVLIGGVGVIAGVSL